MVVVRAKDEPAVQWVTEFCDRSTRDVVFSMTEEEEIERLHVDGAPETFLDEYRRALVAQRGHGLTYLGQPCPKP